ncbi:MAG: glycoside hydrolase family 3 protein, partial [Clostridium sp.]
MKLKKILALGTLVIMGMNFIVPNGFKANATEDSREKAKEIVSKMSLEEKVGQVLMPAISSLKQGSTSVPLDVENFLTKYNIGGIILFANNLQDVSSTVSLTDSFHKVNKDLPLLLAVDQEGGGVTRIPGSTYMNGNMALTAANDLELTKKAGGIIGKETSAVGIDITFAPVLDVYRNPTNTVIGTRSFGDNSKVVSEQGKAFIEGVQGNGASAGAKHYPGNGDSVVDTHADLNVNIHDLKTLQEVDLKPFKAAVDSGVDVIMTSHSAYPALDDKKIYSKLQDEYVYPSATFSKKMVTDILKNEMGFDGVVVTDAMDMQALTLYFNKVDATLLALEAGCDIILMPHPITGQTSIKEFETYFNDVVKGIKDGKVSEERLNDAVT